MLVWYKDRLKGPLPPLYKRAYGLPTKAIRHRSIEAGEKVGGDTISLSRRVLFSHNSEIAIVRRFVLILLWHGVGRDAEYVLTNWTLVEWFHAVNCAVLNWSQSKTGKQKGVAICPVKDGNTLNCVKPFNQSPVCENTFRDTPNAVPQQNQDKTSNDCDFTIMGKISGRDREKNTTRQAKRIAPNFFTSFDGAMANGLPNTIVHADTPIVRKAY